MSYEVLFCVNWDKFELGVFDFLLLFKTNTTIMYLCDSVCVSDCVFVLDNSKQMNFTS